MLLSLTTRNIGRCRAAANSLLHQQKSNLNIATPISYYHNFHRNDETIKTRTGLIPSLNYLNLHKSIHSRSALCLKYSNLLEQKVSENAKKISTGDDEKPKADNMLDALEQGKALGLFARFKKMAKDYWYVLIPVHVATSCCWLGAFYYTSVRYAKSSKTLRRILRFCLVSVVSILLEWWNATNLARRSSNRSATPI